MEWSAYLSHLKAAEDGAEGKGRRLCLRMPCNGNVQGDETKAGFWWWVPLYKGGLPVYSWC